MKLYNSLTKAVDTLTPLHADQVTIYSCGPTVYDTVHIGNLSAFITADTLRRTVTGAGYNVKHIMNFTDIDDKTITRSRKAYPDMSPESALSTLTTQYGDLFIADMKTIGNSTDDLTFIKAAADTTIAAMKELITRLHIDGFAYVADDGVYFSIEAYKKSGKKYGQLVDLSDSSTSEARIQNDEYGKESIHDFALWKTMKPGEPSWSFTLDGHDLTGRPGWHIECSAMSAMTAGLPIDIHTGGIDLAFPHHENEITQSTAGKDNPTYAQFFVHNEHILVDGKKMSKSLNNFYTLHDLHDKSVEPLAFRLLVLQSHYRKPSHFSLENASAAHNRLIHWRNIAALRHQTHDMLDENNEIAVTLLAASNAISEAMSDDMNTPEALRIIDQSFAKLDSTPLAAIHRQGLLQLLETIDTLLGLQLQQSTPDISDEQKELIDIRQHSREEKDWTKSDEIRKELESQGIAVKDTERGSIWECV